MCVCVCVYVCVCVCSNIVGTPLAALLRNKGAAAVTVCHQLSYKE